MTGNEIVSRIEKLFALEGETIEARRNAVCLFVLDEMSRNCAIAYSAGYAARDKLSCASCGEIILDNGKKPS